jgi:hypothetical protein
VTHTLHLNIGRIGAQIKAGAEDGVTLAIEHLLTEANKHVPHDEGTLERSGDTGVETSGGQVRGSVSYDTPYAVKQHEDMSLHHDGKGESKWLENTMAAESGTVGKIIATSISREAHT